MTVNTPASHRVQDRVERAQRTIHGVVIGRLVRLSDDAGRVLVDYPGNPDDHPVLALATTALTAQHVDGSVALAFENGDAARPVVLGPVVAGVPETSPAVATGQAESSVQVVLDAESVLLTAERELTLRCGKASLTLTRAGKVLIRGAYLLSRSSGANRIRGGSVQIN